MPTSRIDYCLQICNKSHNHVPDVTFESELLNGSHTDNLLQSPGCRQGVWYFRETGGDPKTENSNWWYIFLRKDFVMWHWFNQGNLKSSPTDTLPRRRTLCPSSLTVSIPRLARSEAQRVQSQPDTGIGRGRDGWLTSRDLKMGIVQAVTFYPADRISTLYQKLLIHISLFLI